jgi:protein-tyrosine sulfotransferase
MPVPNFVLTLPRSGSTLLRFILDSHPLITCPPESQLALLSSNVLDCWLSYKSPETLEERKELGIRQVRSNAQRLISWHLRSSGKSVFCDKSLPNVENAFMLADIFPRSRFICLYRHPLDFVASAVESCRWGFQSYGLYPYVAGGANNFVFGLVRAWCEKTSIMLALEERYPARTLRVTYETLVRSTATVYQELCEFLSVPDDPAGVSGAMRIDHVHGYGDHKILLTNEIETDSLGRGSAVPVHLMTAPGMTNVNELISHLGYAPIDLQWGLQPSELRRGLEGTTSYSEATGTLLKLLPTLPSPTADPSSEKRPLVRFLVEEFDNPRGWLIDLSKAGLRPNDGSIPAPVTLIARYRGLVNLLSGATSIRDAFSNGDLRYGVCADPDVAAGAARRFDDLFRRGGDADPALLDPRACLATYNTRERGLEE